jgi:fatty acid desaturase
VLTPRNVHGGWLTDVALGGLNYQIEHHLFPSMPRPNLRRSQLLIEAFCQQRRVPYCQSSLAGSYAKALRHLNAVGRPACPGTATSPAASLPVVSGLSPFGAVPSRSSRRPDLR